MEYASNLLEKPFEWRQYMACTNEYMLFQSYSSVFLLSQTPLTAWLLYATINQ